MQALEEAGLPAGVANLVLGAGPEVGAPLSEHPDVDLVSFTGGLETGRRIMATAAADREEGRAGARRQEPQRRLRRRRLRDRRRLRAHRRVPALRAGLLGRRAAASSRTRCTTAFVDELVRRAELIRLGGPFDDDAETGPLISAAHRDKVEAYVAAGLAEGAVLRCGGSGPDDPALAERLLLPADRARRVPTPSMRVVQEESFGPVLTVERFTDEDDAVRIANDTDVRPGRRRLDPGRRQGAAGGAAAAARHGLDQRLPPLRAAGRVGRLQAVRASAASWDRPAWRSTARPSTSGRTSDPGRSDWFSG